MFHLKSDSWNLSDNYSPTPILNRMRSPGHPTPMPRAPLFARSLSAFRPGNLVNFAFKKCKSNTNASKLFQTHEDICQTIHSQKQEKHVRHQVLKCFRIQELELTNQSHDFWPSLFDLGLQSGTCLRTTQAKYEMKTQAWWPYSFLTAGVLIRGLLITFAVFQFLLRSFWNFWELF